MKGFLRLAVVLGLLCAAHQASAQGYLDLKWDECSQSGTAAINKNYGCNLTSGFHTLIASFDPGANYVGQTNGIIADLGIIDVIATDPSATVLPQFWQYQGSTLGGCGSGRITFSVDFTGGPFACLDMWQGLGATGGQFGGKSGPVPEGNTARIKWTSNVLPQDALTVSAGQQYYIAKVNLARSISVCPGGCGDEVCLVFNTYETSLFDGRKGFYYYDQGGVVPPYATFQQGASPVFNCPIPTPTRARSWGEIKSLYR